MIGKQAASKTTTTASQFKNSDLKLKLLMNRRAVKGLTCYHNWHCNIVLPAPWHLCCAARTACSTAQCSLSAA